MTKFCIGVLFIFAQFLLILGKYKSLEAPKCSLDDSQCLEAKFLSIWGNLMDGIPEIGIERLDKMYLGNMTTSNLGLIYKVTNVEVEGLRNITLESFKIDMRLKFIELLFRTTLINHSDHEADGTVFSIPVYGSGKISTTRKNILFNVVTFFDVKKIDGKSYMDLKKNFYGFDVQDRVVCEFGNNMYNGNKKKSDNLLNFLNRNWILMTQNFGKNLLDLVVNKVFDAFNTYMSHHALDEIFIM